MGIRWIEHKGAEILYVDYRGTVDDDERLGIFAQQAQEMHARPGKTRVLSNFDGVAVGSPFVKEVTGRSKAAAADVLEKDALLGITGLKSLLLESYTMISGLKDRVRAFDDEAKALDWLAE